MGLVGLVVYRCIGYSNCVDLHWADEFSYLYNGNCFLEMGQAPNIAWAPAYAVVLAAVEKLLPADLFAFDAMYGICRVLVAVACYWAARPLSHPIVAATFGLWVVLADRLSCDTSPGLMAVGNVYALGLAMCAFLWGALLRGWFIAAAIGSVVLVMVRGEYAVWVCATAFAATALRVRLPRGSPAWGLVIGLGLVALATVPEEARERSWLAFRQHYGGQAMTARLRKAYGDTPQLSDSEALRALYAIEKAAELPDEVIREDFGVVSSTLQAVVAAPAKFFGFVWSNIRNGPSVVDRSLAPGWCHSHWLLLGIWTAAAFGMAVVARSAWMGSWQHGVALAAGLATLPAAAAATSMTLPRVELLFPVTFAVLFFATISVERMRAACGMRWSDGRGRVVFFGWFAFLEFLVLPRSFVCESAEALPVRDSLKALHRCGLHSNTKVLTSEWLEFPVRVMHALGRMPKLEVTTLRGLIVASPSASMPSLVDRGIEVVAWDRRLEFESAMVQGLKAQLSDPPWREAARHGGTILYTRN